MRLQLDSKWIARLVDLPESGMGYQRVRVRLKNGRVIESAVVLNAEVLEVADEVPLFKPADIDGIELAAVPR